MAHTAPSSGTSHVTSITDSASRITWQTAKSAGFTNHPSGDTLEIWYGVVKSAGATTIDVHWSGTTFDHFVWADEWRSAAGSSATWSVTAAGVKNATVCSGGSCAFPSLTAGSTTGLYWGWAYPASTSHAGSTPGVALLRDNRADTRQRPRLGPLGRRRHHADPDVRTAKCHIVV